MAKRHVKEGAEAKHWRRIAEDLEANGGEYRGHEGICCAIVMVPVAGTRQRMFARFRECFAPQDGEHRFPYYWYKQASAFQNYPKDNVAHGRTLAAWLLYWMAMGEGK